MQRFQTTYEELKRKMPDIVVDVASISFQTTYEELKPEPARILPAVIGFQTTYEELKP